ncbi:MAG: DUF4446 family protein [Nitriliruptoraceae bacterium]
MELDASLVALLAVIATSLAGVLAVIVVVLALRLRVLRRAQRRAFAGAERDLLEVVGEQREHLARVDGDVRHLQVRADELRALLAGTVSRVAVVRYDAFEDMGGALSFSAALLDEGGNGVVVSAINGRSETRSYAKSVDGGRSDQNLSAEEVEAIDAALSGRPASAPTPGGRRRRRAS